MQYRKPHDDASIGSGTPLSLRGEAKGQRPSSQLEPHFVFRTLLESRFASLLYVLYTCKGRAAMAKKLTITVEDEVYAGLHNVIGRRRISRFLNDLARPHVLAPDLAEGYRAMAADEEREREAAEWVEGLAGDIADEPR